MFRVFFCLLFPFCLFGGVEFHLRNIGFHEFEGGMTHPQAEQFRHALLSYPKVRNIVEIGFNTGRSAEFFLNLVPTASITSVDIGMHGYIVPAAKWMKDHYGERFHFLLGDSRKVIPNLAQSGHTFDLIFIDGAHEYEIAILDIQNCRHLAHQGTIVWIDDINDPAGTKPAFEECVEAGILEVIQIHNGPDRFWVAAKYKN